MNNYLKKYYKHKEMIVGYVETNLKNLEVYFKNQMENEKKSVIAILPDLEVLKKIEEIENILVEWDIQF